MTFVASLIVIVVFGGMNAADATANREHVRSNGIGQGSRLFSDDPTVSGKTPLFRGADGLHDGAIIKISDRKASVWNVQTGKDINGKMFAETMVAQNEQSFSMNCAEGTSAFHILLFGENVRSLPREDDSDSSVDVTFLSDAGRSASYRMTVWYYAGDKVWTGMYQPSVPFLQDLVIADTMVLRDISGREVANLAVGGADEAVKALASQCGGL